MKIYLSRHVNLLLYLISTVWCTNTDGKSSNWLNSTNPNKIYISLLWYWSDWLIKNRKHACLCKCVCLHHLRFCLPFRCHYECPSNMFKTKFYESFMTDILHLSSLVPNWNYEKLKVSSSMIKIWKIIVLEKPLNACSSGSSSSLLFVMLLGASFKVNLFRCYYCSVEFWLRSSLCRKCFRYYISD